MTEVTFQPTDVGRVASAILAAGEPGAIAGDDREALEAATDNLTPDELVRFGPRLAALVATDSWREPVAAILGGENRAVTALRLYLRFGVYSSADSPYILRHERGTMSLTIEPAGDHGPPIVIQFNSRTLCDFVHQTLLRFQGESRLRQASYTPPQNSAEMLAAFSEDMALAFKKYFFGTNGLGEIPLGEFPRRHAHSVDYPGRLEEDPVDANDRGMFAMADAVTRVRHLMLHLKESSPLSPHWATVFDSSAKIPALAAARLLQSIQEKRTDHPLNHKDHVKAVLRLRSLLGRIIEGNLPAEEVPVSVALLTWMEGFLLAKGSNYLVHRDLIVLARESIEAMKSGGATVPPPTSLPGYHVLRETSSSGRLQFVGIPVSADGAGEASAGARLVSAPVRVDNVHVDFGNPVVADVVQGILKSYAGTGARIGLPEFSVPEGELGLFLVVFDDLLNAFLDSRVSGCRSQILSALKILARPILAKPGFQAVRGMSALEAAWQKRLPSMSLLRLVPKMRQPPEAEPAAARAPAVAVLETPPTAPPAGEGPSPRRRRTAPLGSRLAVPAGPPSPTEDEEYIFRYFPSTSGVPVASLSSRYLPGREIDVAFSSHENVVEAADLLRMAKAEVLRTSVSGYAPPSTEAAILFSFLDDLLLALDMILKNSTLDPIDAVLAKAEKAVRIIRDVTQQTVAALGGHGIEEATGWSYWVRVMDRARLAPLKPAVTVVHGIAFGLTTESEAAQKARRAYPLLVALAGGESRQPSDLLHLRALLSEMAATLPGDREPSILRTTASSPLLGGPARPEAAVGRAVTTADDDYLVRNPDHGRTLQFMGRVQIGEPRPRVHVHSPGLSFDLLLDPASGPDEFFVHVGFVSAEVARTLQEVLQRHAGKGSRAAGARPSPQTEVALLSAILDDLMAVHEKEPPAVAQKIRVGIVTIRERIIHFLQGSSLTACAGGWFGWLEIYRQSDALMWEVVGRAQKALQGLFVDQEELVKNAARELLSFIRRPSGLTLDESPRVMDDLQLLHVSGELSAGEELDIILAFRDMTNRHSGVEGDKPPHAAIADPEPLSLFMLEVNAAHDSVERFLGRYQFAGAGSAIDPLFVHPSGVNARLFPVHGRNRETFGRWLARMTPSHRIPDYLVVEDSGDWAVRLGREEFPINTPSIQALWIDPRQSVETDLVSLLASKGYGRDSAISSPVFVKDKRRYLIGDYRGTVMKFPWHQTEASPQASPIPVFVRSNGDLFAWLEGEHPLLPSDGGVIGEVLSADWRGEDDSSGEWRSETPMRPVLGEDFFFRLEQRVRWARMVDFVTSADGKKESPWKPSPVADADRPLIVGPGSEPHLLFEREGDLFVASLIRLSGEPHRIAENWQAQSRDRYFRIAEPEEPAEKSVEVEERKFRMKIRLLATRDFHPAEGADWLRPVFEGTDGRRFLIHEKGEDLIRFYLDGSGIERRIDKWMEKVPPGEDELEVAVEARSGRSRTHRGLPAFGMPVQRWTHGTRPLPVSMPSPAVPSVTVLTADDPHAVLRAEENEARFTAILTLLQMYHITPLETQEGGGALVVNDAEYGRGVVYEDSAGVLSVAFDSGSVLLFEDWRFKAEWLGRDLIRQALLALQGQSAIPEGARPPVLADRHLETLALFLRRGHHLSGEEQSSAFRLLESMSEVLLPLDYSYLYYALYALQQFVRPPTGPHAAVQPEPPQILHPVERGERRPSGRVATIPIWEQKREGRAPVTRPGIGVAPRSGRTRLGVGTISAGRPVRITPRVAVAPPPDSDGAPKRPRASVDGAIVFGNLAVDVAPVSVIPATTMEDPGLSSGLPHSVRNDTLRLRLAQEAARRGLMATAALLLRATDVQITEIIRRLPRDSNRSRIATLFTVLSKLTGECVSSTERGASLPVSAQIFSGFTSPAASTVARPVLPVLR